MQKKLYHLFYLWVAEGIPGVDGHQETVQDGAKVTPPAWEGVDRRYCLHRPKTEA